MAIRLLLQLLLFDPVVVVALVLFSLTIRERAWPALYIYGEGFDIVSRSPSAFYGPRGWKEKRRRRRRRRGERALLLMYAPINSYCTSILLVVVVVFVFARFYPGRALRHQKQLRPRIAQLVFLLRRNDNDAPGAYPIFRNIVVVFLFLFFCFSLT